jgi:hypothetical protein
MISARNVGSIFRVPNIILGLDRRIVNVLPLKESVSYNSHSLERTQCLRLHHWGTQLRHNE